MPLQLSNVLNQAINVTFTDFVLLILQPLTIILLILSPVNLQVEQKPDIPEKTHLTTCKQNLACVARLKPTAVRD